MMSAAVERGWDDCEATTVGQGNLKMSAPRNNLTKGDAQTFNVEAAAPKPGPRKNQVAGGAHYVRQAGAPANRKRGGGGGDKRNVYSDSSALGEGHYWPAVGRGGMGIPNMVGMDNTFGGLGGFPGIRVSTEGHHQPTAVVGHQLHQQVPQPQLHTLQQQNKPFFTPAPGKQQLGNVGTGGISIGIGRGAAVGTYHPSLDVKDLSQAHEALNAKMNPYAAAVIDTTNMPSPGTQFFGAYAPTPLAMSTPNTLRAYAHGELSFQEEKWAGNHGGAFNGGAPVTEGAASVNLQQYYTQEPIAMFESYGFGMNAGTVGAGLANADCAMGMYPFQDMAAVANAVGAATTVPGAVMMRGTPQAENAPLPVQTGHMHNPSGPQMQNSYGRSQRNGRSGSGAPNGGRGGYRGESRRGRGDANQDNDRDNLPPGSETLERFRADIRAGQVEEWRLRTIAGHAVEFAKDQEGSRFIQRMLDSATFEEVDNLFFEIFESPQDVMTDIFGNYVLQKLLDVGNDRQLTYAASRLRNIIVPMTLQTYGCRVIQKCIEVMPLEGIELILAELEGNVARCIQDQNGNHVVQKCIEFIPQRCGFIIAAFTGRVMELATHAYGCRVIQCIMRHCPEQESIIFGELYEGLDVLATDQYGNYVIQYILERVRDDRKINKVYQALKPNYYRFSKQKYASNVMEKLYRRVTATQRSEIVNLLCQPVPPSQDDDPHGPQLQVEIEQPDGTLGMATPSTLCRMMNDPYANYVVQRVIEASNEDQKRRLLANIQKFSLPIRSYLYGRPIIMRLEKSKLITLPRTAE